MRVLCVCVCGWVRVDKKREKEGKCVLDGKRKFSGRESDGKEKEKNLCLCERECVCVKRKKSKRAFVFERGYMRVFERIVRKCEMKIVCEHNV